MMDSASSLARQHWLEAGLTALRPWFAKHGYTVPENIRVSVGFPRVRGGPRAIGQCWSDAASTDGATEIFVTPELGDAPNSVRILGVLAHEVVHAVVGTESGHKAPFKRCALAVGLEGKMPATTESPRFIAWAEQVIAEIGPYPAGALRNEKRAQSTRLIKCQCRACGYVARVTRQWIDGAGPPVCPAHMIGMEIAQRAIKRGAR